MCDVYTHASHTHANTPTHTHTPTGWYTHSQTHPPTHTVTELQKVADRLNAESRQKFRAAQNAAAAQNVDLVIPPLPPPAPAPPSPAETEPRPTLAEQLTRRYSLGLTRAHLRVHECAHQVRTQARARARAHTHTHLFMFTLGRAHTCTHHTRTYCATKHPRHTKKPRRC